MSARSDRLRRKARDVVSKRGGVACTLTRRSSGAYDPATSAAAPTTATSAAYAAVFPDEHSGDSDETDEADVVEERRKAEVPALGLLFDPAVGDSIGPLEGRTWNVVGVTSTSVDGAYVLHEVRLKG